MENKKKTWEIETEFFSDKIEGLAVRVSKQTNTDKPWYAPRMSITIGKVVDSSKGRIMLTNVHVNLTGAHLVDIEISELVAKACAHIRDVLVAWEESERLKRQKPEKAPMRLGKTEKKKNKGKSAQA